MRECKACKAKDQTIVILADEVDYLRAQLAMRPQGFVPNAPPLNPTNQPEMQVGIPPYVSEEEAEFRQMFADGHIDEDELNAALQVMGFNTTPESPVGDEWNAEV